MQMPLISSFPFTQGELSALTTDLLQVKKRKKLDKRIKVFI
jgi:hypothetical protein